jgi:DNA helicase HerA-like ATPase
VTTMRLSDELVVPTDLATEGIAILGKRGSGKTNTAVDLVEEMIDAGIPVVVVDTVGVWWGMQSPSDAKGGRWRAR